MKKVPNKKTYFIFGEMPSREYLDNGGNLKKIKKMLKNDACDAALFCFEENVTTPGDLLEAYDGWNGFAGITEKEYEFLSKK